jgi:hypothetical protein
MHERIVCELWEGVIFYDDHPDWACNKAQTGLPSLLRFAMVSKVGNKAQAGLRFLSWGGFRFSLSRKVLQ